MTFIGRVECVRIPGGQSQGVGSQLHKVDIGDVGGLVNPQVPCLLVAACQGHGDGNRSRSEGAYAGDVGDVAAAGFGYRYCGIILIAACEAHVAIGKKLLMFIDCDCQPGGLAGGYAAERLGRIGKGGVPAVHIAVKADADGL